MPTQPHLKPAAARPMAATGKLLAGFQQGGDTESSAQEPGLTLLPTVAEAELGQRVSHGVCKESGLSSKEKKKDRGPPSFAVLCSQSRRRQSHGNGCCHLPRGSPHLAWGDPGPFSFAAFPPGTPCPLLPSLSLLPLRTVLPAGALPGTPCSSSGMAQGRGEDGSFRELRVRDKIRPSVRNAGSRFKKPPV